MPKIASAMPHTDPESIAKFLNVSPRTPPFASFCDAQHTVTCICDFQTSAAKIFASALDLTSLRLLDLASEC